MKTSNFNKTLATILLSCVASMGYAAGIFTIEPNYSLPTHIVIGQEAIVSYTVKNISGGALHPSYTLQDGVVQDTTVPNSCGAVINDSCTLRLKIKPNTLTEIKNIPQICSFGRCNDSHHRLNIKVVNPGNANLPVAGLSPNPLWLDNVKPDGTINISSNAPATNPINNVSLHIPDSIKDRLTVESVGDAINCLNVQQGKNCSFKITAKPDMIVGGPYQIAIRSANATPQNLALQLYYSNPPLVPKLTISPSESIVLINKKPGDITTLEITNPSPMLASNVDVSELLAHADEIYTVKGNTRCGDLAQNAKCTLELIPTGNGTLETTEIPIKFLANGTAIQQTFELTVSNPLGLTVPAQVTLVPGDKVTFDIVKSASNLPLANVKFNNLPEGTTVTSDVAGCLEQVYSTPTTCKVTAKSDNPRAPLVSKDVKITANGNEQVLAQFKLSVTPFDIALPTLNQHLTYKMIAIRDKTQQSRRVTVEVRGDRSLFQICRNNADDKKTCDYISNCDLNPAGEIINSCDIWLKVKDVAANENIGPSDPKKISVVITDLASQAQTIADFNITRDVSLYFGGDFAKAGNQAKTSRIARLSRNEKGSYAFYPLGDEGIDDNAVNTLALYNGDLYIGGTFTKLRKADNSIESANRLARWNGDKWSALKNGVNNGVNGAVNALQTWQIDPADKATERLYIAGAFSDLNGGGGNRLLTVWDHQDKWLHTTYDMIANSGRLCDNGFKPGYVTSLALYANRIYAAGNFCVSSNSGLWNSNRAVFLRSIEPSNRWNYGTGQQGSGFGWGFSDLSTRQAVSSRFAGPNINARITNAPENLVTAMLSWKGADGKERLIVGGTMGAFSKSSVGYTDDAAKFHTFEWRWDRGNTRAFLVDPEDKGKIYIAGRDLEGGSFITQINMPHDEKWTPVSNWKVGPRATPSDIVFAMAKTGGKLYVGGTFKNIEGTDTLVNSIAYWDGEKWHPLMDADNANIAGVTLANGSPGLVRAMLIVPSLTLTQQQ